MIIFTRIFLKNGIFRGLLLLWLLTSGWPAIKANAHETDKHAELTAAFIYKMVNFTSWPEGSDPVATDQKLTVCLSGYNEGHTTHFVQHLQSNLQDYFNTVAFSKTQDCPIIFFVHSDHASLDQALKTLSDLPPKLTFGASSGFAQQGVMINFYKDHEKLRFEINQRALRQAGIQISSRVLKLARIVDE